MIVAEYKGEQIAFYEHDESWTWGTYSNTSFKKVAEYIDRALRAERQPTEAYYFGYTHRGEPKIVTATSPASDDDGYWWIKNARGKREKVGPLFEISPDNVLVIEQMKAKALDIEAEEKKLGELFKSLKRLTTAHMTKGEPARDAGAQ